MREDRQWQLNAEAAAQLFSAGAELWLGFYAGSRTV